MGLFGKLKSGLSSASKHLKKRHFKMTVVDLADNWEKLKDAGDVYLSFTREGQTYEIDKVRKEGEGRWEAVEIWYYKESEDEGVYETERERFDRTVKVWVHLSEAQYEKLVEKHGDFLKKFEE